jgi:signal transduction histidine kinase
MAVSSDGSGRMTLGLPPHLAPRAVSRSFISAIHVTAVVCLVGAMVVSLAFQLEWPNLIFWPAVLALVPMLVALYLLDRSPTRFFSVSYLIIGGASVYWYSLTFASQIDLDSFADSITVALPKIALMLVGGAGIGAAAALRCATSGFLVAELASGVAIVQTPQRYGLDEISIAAYLITAMVLVGSWIGQSGARRMQPLLYRAAKEELVAALRHRMELRAAALLHDTLLNHLTVIAESPPGEVAPMLREQIGRDLALLVGEEWLTEAPRADASSDTEWHDSDLYRAVCEARAMGLDVDTTGDTTALLRLEGEKSRELALAVKQCLVNVLAHSGSSDAEVVVYGADDEVLVMVVDTGCGFDTDAIGSDRLGLKTSVHQRIEAVGGTVQVWSTAGRGTSIVIRLPVGPASPTRPIASVGAQ